ncbi:MAG: nucleotidyl transferase AbiEii/AbiGii toxin family protein [Bacilli bacterium]|nr:nucleotidyl transferase AbiEii/AbiGii toxin family protein [Bacilli bacterium]
MLLSDDEQLFKELLKRTRRHFNIDEAFVEKDFYVVTILKEIVAKDDRFVFKGGTSLSKCYHLIDRFSEDIDLASSELKLTTSQRRKLIRHIVNGIEGLGFEISNKENIRSGMRFNSFDIPYKTAFASAAVKNKVLIELATQTPSFPNETRPIQTFIGQYLHDVGRDDLVEKYGLEQFEVKVQIPMRTVVDKLFALCDYAMSGRIEKHSRHIYDIHQLSAVIKIDDEFKKLFMDVREYRKELRICLSAQNEICVSDVLTDIIDKDLYEIDYKANTYPLLYKQVSYEKCKQALSKIRDKLIELGL